MGWLYSTSHGSAAGLRKHLRESLTHSGNEVVKDATTNFGRHYFAAVKSGKDGTVSLFVALLNSYREGGATWWGYKDMDEGMGPCNTDCPVSVLDVLSPVEAIYGPVKADGGAAKWATEYRAACRATAAAKAASTKAAKALKAGDKVWVRNAAHNPFTVAAAGKNAKGTFRVTGYDARGYGVYKLPVARIDKVEAA